MATEAPGSLSRRHLSQEQFEEAFERQQLLEQERRKKLRKRAAHRSRARKVERAERSGKVRFSVLAVALTATVVVVVIVMFEVLAWLVGG
jgi:cytoskeletal protein RodZ